VFTFNGCSQHLLARQMKRSSPISLTIVDIPNCTIRAA
jgi:hypothetical protein